MPLLSARNLTLDYPSRQGVIRVLDGISFELEKGQTLGLVGESGSGKSQTALALMGLLPAGAQLTGSLNFDGIDLLNLGAKDWLKLRGSRIAMIFQDPMSSLNPHLSIGTQLSEVLVQHRGASWAVARAESQRMLEAVKVGDAARRLAQYPHEFSGGMRQRVMIAMMLLARPSLLIADEPTTALDVTVQARILLLLAELKVEMGLTLLFISHDLGVISEVADRVLVLYGGRVMEAGPSAELLAAPQHPYTRGLLACRPTLQGTGTSGPLPTIAGAPRQAGPPDSGCPFALRCAQVLPVCATQTPAWRDTAANRGRACHLL